MTEGSHFSWKKCSRLCVALVVLAYWAYRLTVLTKLEGDFFSLTSGLEGHFTDAPITNTTPNNATPTNSTFTIKSSLNRVKVFDGSTSNISQPRPHPHAGARFSNGSWGYVTDVSLARSYMKQKLIQHFGNDTSAHEHAFLPFDSKQQFDAVCNIPPRKGKEKKAGWRLLSGHVIVSNLSSPSLVAPSDSNRSSPKILCAVYTYAGARDRLSAVIETWGWRCDGFFAASTETVDDPTLPGFGATDLPHVGPESYNNMWQKTRSIWAYIYDNFLDDFDYFYLSGDDTHLIVENLRLLLSEFTPDDSTKPLYLGHWIPFRGDFFFVGGGPGYVLNRKALEMFVEQALPTCIAKSIASSEDRFLSRCFLNMGVTPNSTVDSKGAQRFHGMDANFVASFRGDKGFFHEVYKFWGSLNGFKWGFDLVSPVSVSFHLLKTPNSMKRHHAILYRSCPNGTVLGDALALVDQNKTFAN